MELETEVILFLIGIALTFYSVNKYFKGKSLLSKGIIVKGVVFKKERELNMSGEYETVETIRFLTKKDEWITEKLSPSLLSLRNEGDKIEVIYKPEDPREFDINSSISLVLIPLASIAIGLTLILFSVSKYFNLNIHF